MTIDQTDVLNVKVVRDDKDERHLCPLQLDVIERCVELYTNEGETVYSPFMGIGSEGYQSMKMSRKFIGTELKPAYFNQAIKNLDMAENEGPTTTLFEKVM
jgi:DNA modification methylase